MQSSSFSDKTLRRKKMLILGCGVIIYFLTSMAKVLIPGTILNDLLKSGMDIDRIANLGASFMYAYAASQLVMGCFSDRYGGVRILLIGGTVFTAGTIGFPLVSNYYLMIFFRIITGFGAGTIFLGVAKLIGDLFSAKFSIALGTVMVFSYLGPTTGTLPMVKLVEAAGWKMAMLLPGLVAAVPLLLIFLFMKGTIKPVTRGQTLAPLKVMAKNKNMWFICFSCATVYGAYYSLVGQIGKKIFTDVFAVSGNIAALCIMILTIIVAFNNMGVNLMLKLAGNRRKTVVFTGVCFSTLGVLLAYHTLYTHGSWVTFMISAILIAFPAGFFPLFSLTAKELNPSKYIGMSVAFLNFMAFLFISLYQKMFGIILQKYAPAGSDVVFPVEAYCAIYIFCMFGAIVSLTAAILVPETRSYVEGKRQN